MHRLLPLVLIGLLAGSACSAQTTPTYVVFFQEWSAALDNSAQGVVREAATWAHGHPGSQITVTGFADTTGSQKANALLSELRAQMVVDQLTADGVEESRIRQSGVGSVDAAFNKQQARRVQVSFTAQ